MAAINEPAVVTKDFGSVANATTTAIQNFGAASTRKKGFVHQVAVTSNATTANVYCFFYRTSAEGATYDLTKLIAVAVVAADKTGSQSLLDGSDRTSFMYVDEETDSTKAGLHVAVRHDNAGSRSILLTVMVEPTGREEA